MRLENTKLSPANVFLQAANALQESWAITKMTARCALYGFPENFRESLGTPTATKF